MRSPRAMAVIRADENDLYVATMPKHARAAEVDLRELFEERQSSRIGHPRMTALEYYGSRLFNENYPDQVVQARFSSTAGEHRVFDWAAFAYAGLRTVADVRIAAVQDPTTSPFEKSLSFLETADTHLLANWIVSQNYRRLKAKEAGEHDLAAQLAESIRRIEQIIAEIVGDPSFAFDINPKDDDVRIRWRGVTVRIGLLPDGLKSIVSWVADLLMRLDRIPWKDNTPVLQRRFLLLLDEIDIHLHPAWQRKVLPLVQRMFPNAQIIASTHSPFVVGSMADGRIITLGFEGGSAVLKDEAKPQLGVSYSAVLRSIFGIESEFDVDTEDKLRQFHDARRRLLIGEEAARSEVDQLADVLVHRSEELREIIALELGQLRRQLALRAAP
jgi:predicted ATP-binding protein involved in virulence